ncbi:hypothetical protein D3C85_1302130 [compost metagenome]
MGRLAVLPGAHEQRRQAAERYFLPADRHAQPRGDGQADPHHGRLCPRQRGVAGERARAAGKPGGRGGQGLALCQVPAAERAYRRRHRRPGLACARPPQASRLRAGCQSPAADRPAAAAPAHRRVRAALHGPAGSCLPGGAGHGRRQRQRWRGLADQDPRHRAVPGGGTGAGRGARSGWYRLRWRGAA